LNLNNFLLRSSNIIYTYLPVLDYGVVVYQQHSLLPLWMLYIMVSKDLLQIGNCQPIIVHCIKELFGLD